jgi:oligoendopeptidase F
MEEAAPIARRYVDLKGKLMNTDKITLYDIYAPLTTGERSITYEEGTELIKTTPRPLGKESEISFLNRII